MGTDFFVRRTVVKKWCATELFGAKVSTPSFSVLKRKFPNIEYENFKERIIVKRGVQPVFQFKGFITRLLSRASSTRKNSAAAVDSWAQMVIMRRQ